MFTANAIQFIGTVKLMALGNGQAFRLTVFVTMCKLMVVACFFKFCVWFVSKFYGHVFDAPFSTCLVFVYVFDCNLRCYYRILCDSYTTIVALIIQFGWWQSIGTIVKLHSWINYVNVCAVGRRSFTQNLSPHSHKIKYQRFVYISVNI